MALLGTEITMETTHEDMREPAEICRERGWTVGTRLVGDEGYGPTVIEITAIGEEKLLAKTISHKGVPSSVGEGLWTLSYRDWNVVPNAELRREP